MENNHISPDRRLARLCYNTEGWKRPSGPVGKSPSSSSHENRQGYGHEEWFFDLEKTIDGWHYTFLRPVDRFQRTYQGRKFDVRLYTRTPDNSFVFVGEVKHMEVNSPDEENRAMRIYKENGWLAEMIEQVNKVSFIHREELNNLFTVRFRPEDVIIYNEWVPVAEEDNISNRYIFYYDRRNVVSQAVDAFIPNEPSLEESEKSTIMEGTILRKASDIWRNNIHTRIQVGLHQYLNIKYPGCTRREAGFEDGGQRIDLKFRHPETGNFIFFEIKTYENDVRTCIRAALGQLLEYAYYNATPDPETQLVIVSQNSLDDISQKYLEHLHDQMGMPVGYLQFDWQNGKILDSLYCDNL
jgi:hypothetical protein